MLVRIATANDYDAYVRLFPELGVDDPVPARGQFASELAARTIVAVDGDAVVGYALYEVMADSGYIRNIVSDPARRRSGIGAALMADMRARFVAAGAVRWCLNVKPENAAAIALYEACGLRVAYKSTSLRVWREIELPAPDVELRDIAADEDAVVEPRFGLLPGQLAASRPKQSRRVVGIVRANEVVGVGVFAAAFPGAFPFRLLHPGDAPAFLAHLRVISPPDARYVQVGVEDDEPLRAAILALGAGVYLDLLHMRGAL